MELRLIDLDRYARLVAPDRRKLPAKLADRIRRGEVELADIRVNPELTAALRLVPLGPRSAVLAGPYGDDAGAATLLPETMARVRELGIEEISFRPSIDELGPAFRAAVLEHGFRLLGERVEFKTDVLNLPTEEGTPLTWRNLDEVGLEAAAAMMAQTAKGDPTGHSERDQPLATMREMLADPMLTDGPDCVHVGYEGDRAVAFVLAQILPKTGWSRISYMGVIPAARGRGLGKWVHRHGFAMIRAQGGTLYHGGTATTNAAMIRLFQLHDCTESDRMFEIEWESGAAPV